MHMPDPLSAGTPQRLDDVVVRMRRLVSSPEPAIVFSSLVRLCVPLFCDACSVDIVEGGRVRYRISYPPQFVPAPADSTDSQQVVTEFDSALAGWSGYSGVLTHRWNDHTATAEDEARAAAVVKHAIDVIRRERLDDPLRSAVGPVAAPLRRQARHR